jgi:hypothetical protein
LVSMASADDVEPKDMTELPVDECMEDYKDRSEWKEEQAAAFLVYWARTRFTTPPAADDAPLVKAIKSGDAASVDEILTRNPRAAEAVREHAVCPVIFYALFQPAAPKLVRVMLKHNMPVKAEEDPRIELMDVLFALAVAEHFLYKQRKWTQKRGWKHIRDVWAALLEAGGEAMTRFLTASTRSSTRHRFAAYCGAWQLLCCLVSGGWESSEVGVFKTVRAICEEVCAASVVLLRGEEASRAEPPRLTKQSTGMRGFDEERYEYLEELAKQRECSFSALRKTTMRKRGIRRGHAL